MTSSQMGRDLADESGFSLPVRVYIEDTDVGGVVFYANYLKYFERARTEYIRALGFELRAGFEEGVSYVVHSINVRYLIPARLDQLLNVTATVKKLGRTYIDFQQSVKSTTGELMVDASVRVACVSLENDRPRSLPVDLAGKLSAHR